MPHLAHVIALRPTPQQVRWFRKAAGCARLAYNWSLARWNQRFQEGGKPTWQSIQKEFIRVIDQQFPFMREVPCAAYYQPVRHLGQAFARFFAKLGNRPTFKRKHGTVARFKVGAVRCTDRGVIIPRIGLVRCAEALRFPGRVISATVAADGERWTISVLVDVPAESYRIACPAIAPVVGVDLGLTVAATLSDGRQIAPARSLRRGLKRLRRLSRIHSRRQRGSRRSQRACRRLARFHRRIRNLRQHFLHHLTTSIVREHQTIVLEDLQVRGMLKNHRLARALSDGAFGEFRRQMTYKACRYGRTLLVANRFYPSSKRCWRCGVVKAQLGLSEREFVCEGCGWRADRDINAAKNLSTLAESGIHARGEHTVMVLEGNLQKHPARTSAKPDVTVRLRKDGTTP